MATNSIHFFKFNMKEKMSIEEISELIFTPEDEFEDRFILNDYSDNTMDGCYISYYNSKEMIYDEKKGSIEEIIVRKNVIVPFSIDIDNNLLDIWSNYANANKLIARLGLLLKHNIYIESINIDIKRIISKLGDSNLKVSNVKIENYILENDIIANCVFDLKNHSNPKEILEKYEKNLVKLTLSILNNDESTTIIIYKSGSVVIYKSRKEISLETLEMIRDICVR